MTRDFKFVPEEATASMIEAGYQAHKVPYATIERIWDAMIKDAPLVTSIREDAFKGGWEWGKFLGREDDYRKALEAIRDEAGQYVGCSCGQIDCAAGDCWGCRMSTIVSMVSEVLGDDDGNNN